MGVFDTNNKSNHLDSLAFLDPNGGVTIQRFDVLKYKYFDKLSATQRGFFWQPEEVDLTRDASDFKKMSDHEKHIFTSNLQRQILLDSIQSRSASLAFLPIVSLPEIETWIQTWSFSETVHSLSYTHIIRNIYSDPSKVFDNMINISHIVDCATDISKYYDELISKTTAYNFLGVGTHTVNGHEVVVNLYDLKKSLWLALMSVNILEGVRFYVSFCCSFNFGEIKCMEGNAKIIKLICKDENLHLASTQMLLKTLVKDDPDYVKIAEETEQACIELFRDAVNQEKAWAAYLFKDGSVIGLNEKLLCDYIEWIANKRMASVNLPTLYTIKENPLPFMNRWISGADVQMAPQEVEITSYTNNEIVRDVKEDTFKGFEL